MNTRYCFYHDKPFNYMGGYTYLLNLVTAMNFAGVEKNNILIFVSKKMPTKLTNDLKRYALVIPKGCLTKWNVFWMVHKLFLLFFKKTPFLNLYMRKHNLDIVYFNYWPGFKSNKFKQIYWIPDFQHIVFPKYFPRNYIKLFNSHINRQLKNLDGIVLSSYSMKEELTKYFNIKNQSRTNLKVLQFRSSIVHHCELKLVKDKIKNLILKNKLTNGYLFCPNQFWQHKNHENLVEAFNIFKINNPDNNLKLIFSGNKYDSSTGKETFDRVFNKINTFKNKYDYLYFENLSFLEMQSLFSGALAVVNPSFYEGWSTTIEEARAFKIPTLLSNIKVNIEQNPPNAFFFNPNSVNDIYMQIENLVCKSNIGKKYLPLNLSEERLTLSTLTNSHKELKFYGERFIAICKEIIEKVN